MTEDYGFFDMLRDVFLDKDEVSSGGEVDEKDECDSPDRDEFYNEILDDEEGKEEEERVLRYSFYGELIFGADEEEEECDPSDGDESRDNDSNADEGECDSYDGGEGMASLPSSIP